MMASVLIPSRPVPQRPLTVADLAALPSELPSGPVKYELDNGRLEIMAPAADDHVAAQVKILTQLCMQGEYRDFGVARGEIGIILWRNPDRFVVPDAAFTVKPKLPLRLTREGYHETIPDLIVEVRSKNDKQAEIDSKIADYLTAGVRLIWVPDPRSRTVTSYRPDQPSQVLTESDTLTCDDIIPGFRMPVSDVFVV